jgi:hypothetical protein
MNEGTDACMISSSMSTAPDKLMLVSQSKGKVQVAIHIWVHDWPHAPEKGVHPFGALLRSLLVGYISVAINVGTSFQAAHTLRMPDTRVKVEFDALLQPEKEDVCDHGRRDE